ncbi:MAG: hypothetical protein P8J37_15400 [Fuerstiella sp.]|nr:hypothetical protein [Fuerstiella sp.]
MRDGESPFVPLEVISRTDILKLYEKDAHKPGSFANTGLMARRLAER